MDIIHGYELKIFNQLYREIDELYHSIAVKMELSDSAFHIFYTICDLGDGCLQRDICKITSISKQTINSAVQKLEREGYLVLKQGKGRDMHIFLTDKGKEFTNRKIQPVIHMENHVFQEMSEEESHELLRLTRKYKELLQEKSKELL